MSENTDQNTANERLYLSHFEGHTPGPWREILDQGPEDYNGWDELQEMGFNDEARDLIAAAPDLLAALRELLDAIHWEPFSEDDTTLEIDRAVAERIRGKVDA